jgi:hypothetical protein
LLDWFHGVVDEYRVTFAFRNDARYTAFDNAWIVDLTRPSGNLLLSRKNQAGQGDEVLRVIADKGYDSLRQRLRRRGIVLIAPLRLNLRGYVT